MNDSYKFGGAVPDPNGVASVNISGNSGWSCPKCGCVMSPTTPVCLYCNKNPNFGDKTKTENDEYGGIVNVY